MTWSAARAERHLLSLELFGMRFGLERMRRLLTALGSPQSSFRAIHVVGTNGKSSTVRFAEAMLEAHGVRSGAYLSPHLTTFAERIRVGCADVTPLEFGRTVERAAKAAKKVERGLDEDDKVTQFELLTAAAFSELSRAEVDVAVIEAGLGGRYDATNVLNAPVVVLTNVGLEHTRWLGPTITDIAGEKLAVVPAGGTVVCGPLHPEAREVALHLDAKIVEVTEPLDVALPHYQRLNAAASAAGAPSRDSGRMIFAPLASARATTSGAVSPSTSVAPSRTTASFSPAMSAIVGPSQRVCSNPTLVSTTTCAPSTFVAS